MLLTAQLKEMQKNHFLHWNGAVASDFLLLSLNGSETVSTPFCYELRSVTALDEKGIAALHGKAVSCEIGDGIHNLPRRYLHGIVTRIQRKRDAYGQTECLFRLEPAFALLQSGRSTRVWQNMTVADLVSKLLGEHNISQVDLQLRNSYQKREYCIQYRESDFDFISRLLEEEGIYYFFKHQENQHQMVLADHPAGQPESSLAHWHRVLAFEHKICTWPDSRDDMIAKEGDLSMETFDVLAATFSSIEISQRAGSLERLKTQLDRLEACYFSLSQEEPHALFAQTRQSLSDSTDFLQRLAQRAIPTGSEMLNLDFTDLTDEPVAFERGDAYQAPGRNQLLSREQAISQMLSIAHFFRQTEPSSPVPFLMERAARWANMTLTEWLDEMLTDSGSMREINNVLKGQKE
ncbi:MAG: type VI secretion system tip protein VgrG [Serratia sp.]|nr:type VI secretion system tip protein VgrG [Serratia sp. (in: enterobacteria)]